MGLGKARGRVTRPMDAGTDGDKQEGRGRLPSRKPSHTRGGAVREGDWTGSWSKAGRVRRENTESW